MKRFLLFGAVLAMVGITGPTEPLCSLGLGPARAGAQGVCITCAGCDCRGYCVTEECFAQQRLSKLSPAERTAEEAKIERERQRKLEVVRKEKLVFDRKVDAQLANMGGNPARRAEAERFVRMQEAAAAARAKLPPPRQCTPRTWSQPLNSSGKTRDAAFASMTSAVARKSGCTIGGSESLTSMSMATAANCTQRALPTMTLPPVGTCLACISENQATTLGWIKGKGWPPPETEWVCTATVQCAAQKCGNGTAAVSEQ